MDYLIYFIMGILITVCFFVKPLKIEIHHKYENVNPELPDIDMDELEQKMLKEDPKIDAAYKDLDSIVADVGDIMGGSDRV